MTQARVGVLGCGALGVWALAWGTRQSTHATNTLGQPAPERRPASTWGCSLRVGRKAVARLEARIELGWKGHDHEGSMAMAKAMTAAVRDGELWVVRTTGGGADLDGLLQRRAGVGVRRPH